MGVLQGLAAFEDELEDSGGKTRYFKPDSGSTVKVWFLDDLAEGTPAVDAGAGLATMISQHQAGKNYMRRAQCTKKDEGRCYGCEQALAHPQTGWGVSKRVYVNVLVDDGKSDPYVAVWNIATKRSAVWPLLKEAYIDDGTIADAPWRVRRIGEGTDTTFTLKKLSGEPADFGSYNRFDLTEIVTYVPYDEQEEHYNKTFESSKPDNDDDDAGW